MNSTSSSPEDVPPPRESRLQGGRLGWVSALLVGIALGGVGLILVARHTQLPLWSRLLGRNTGLDVSQLAVVNQIQQLQRLETVVYSVDKIVSGEKENAILPDFLAGDRLLMLVHGEVVAGVDFQRLNSGDVTVEGKHVRLHLPEAQVFSTRLDNARTRVYSRQTGWLVPVDPNLETKVRQEAERQIQQAALVDGILKTAHQNARTTLTGLLEGLGFTSVEFH